jgi:hypothetical protein
MTTIANLMGAGVPASQAQMTVGKPVTGLSGAGTSSQGAATAITADVSVFSTVALNSGARLPAQNAASMTALAGDIYVVANFGANPLLVYPPTGGNISNAGVNTAVSIPVNKTADFYCLGGNIWAASIGS